MRFVSFFLCLIFLASCATTKTPYSKNSKRKASKPYSIARTAIKDGPPLEFIRKFFKDPVPKNEPFSRYGNPGSYAVYGRTYNVMKSSGGYKARGIASWYGTKFHKQRTSSGDKYNMYAMTAAHRTLPLPTYVRVKNLNNGRVAVVKINDRGPFHSNRLIDLSYGAAAKLGVFPKGTAMVEIEAISTGKQFAHYYVQAGAFSSQKLAQELKQKLSKITSNRIHIENFSHRYIVKVGPLANKGLSDNLRAQLARKGVKGTISVIQ